MVDNSTPTRAHLGDAVMLPELFRRSGWRTIKVGKIFHTGNEFEDPRSWDVDVRETKQAKSPPAAQILRKQGSGGVVLRAKDEDTWDGFVARRAVALLEETVREGKPFFVAAGFRRPHTPYIAPEKYFALYHPDELHPRSGPPEHLAKIPLPALTYRTGVNPKFPDKRPGDTIAAYYAAISFMDAQVGVLLDALDRLGLWERTIVVFQSDHGYHLGEHGGLWHKLSLFEECARVPLIMAVPGRRPGVTERLVETVDVYPTLAELCGLRPPSNLEATSFRPLLDDPARPWKRAVFTVVSRPNEAQLKAGEKFGTPDVLGRTVFDGRWRYTEWPGSGAELYDHQSDPFEYANLATSPEALAQRERMKQLLAAGWQAAQPLQP